MKLTTIPFDTSILPETKGAYIVGGSTRDLLLGLNPVDYDIAVSQNPELFAGEMAVRSGGKLIRMGRPGKMSFRVVAGEHIYDVTPFSGESIFEDLQHRDFTINALAIDLASGNLIDCVGGENDLAQEQVRMVSETAFQRDPVRLLRAYRMAASFGFTIEHRTRLAIEQCADQIRSSAGERIRSEFFKILSTPDSHHHIQQMADTGLLQAIFPELKPLQGCVQPASYHEHDVFQHTLVAYAHLEAFLGDPQYIFPTDHPDNQPLARLNEAASLKCAMLLHDIGKPPSRIETPTGDIHFYDHEKKGAVLAEKICRRLRFSMQEQRLVEWVIRHHTRPLHLFNAQLNNTLSTKAITRLFMTCGEYTPYLLLHALADMTGKSNHRNGDTNSFSAFIRTLFKTYYENYLPKKSQPPLITGQDLISEFGLSPSALFKKLLLHVEETRLSDENIDRPAALKLVAELLRAEAGCQVPGVRKTSS